MKSKAEKIVYEKENIPRETMISYQNEIGMAMNPIFETDLKTRPVKGFAGKLKHDIDLVIQDLS